MKSLFLLFITIFHFFSKAQNFEKQVIGDWTGVLHIGDKKLDINFHFVKKDKSILGSMDSPNQGAYGLSLDKVDILMNYINLELTSFKIKYKGKFINNDSIAGEFIQGEYSGILNLKKSKTQIVSKPKRPQEPKGPFYYSRKEVQFENTIDNIKLAGTLTYPRGKGPFPAVVLVTGSGPQNRDEEIMGHKPFLVISDYLTRHGIAVLRYDDRGVGESEGDFQQATTANFAMDAQAAYVFLKNQKKINKNKIGLVGHSEGGMIAQMVAAADTQVRMIVLLAAPGIKIENLMLKQTETTMKINGLNQDEIAVTQELNKRFYQVVKEDKDDKIAIEKIEKIINDHCLSMPLNEANEIKKQTPMLLKTLLSPWFKYFINLDPYSYLIQIKCPVLAINGKKDVQVDCDDNLFGIAMALEKGGNRKYEFHKMENLNHLMQNSKTGAVSEYMHIEETFSKDVLKIMKNWIKAR